MGLPRSLFAGLCGSLLAGCGALVSLGDDPPPPLFGAPDGGPPLGGSGPVDWGGDAAVDPTDASVPEDAALPRDGGHDGGRIVDAGSDAGDLYDGGIYDGGSLDDAGQDLDGGELDAGRDGGPDGGAVTGPCGTISQLEDYFQDPPKRWLLEASGNVSISHEGTYVHMDVASGATGVASLRSRWRTSLLEDGIKVRFPTLSTASGIVTAVELRGRADDPLDAPLVQLSFDGSSYQGAVVHPAAGINNSNQTSGGAREWWRIRHVTSTNRIVLAVSDVDGSWQTVLDVVAPSFLDDVSAHISVLAEAPATAERVSVGRVVGLLESPRWCPMAELVDDFSAELGPPWEIVDDDNCLIAVASEELTLVQDVGGVVACSVRAATPRELAGSAITVKLTDWPPSGLPDTYAGLHVQLAGGYEAWLGIRNTTVRGTVTGPNISDGEVSSSLSPSAVSPMAYLQLAASDDGSTLYFRHSADGSAWDTFWTYSAMPNVDDAVPYLALYNFNGASTEAGAGVDVRFDSVNEP